jgi:anti-sigma factor RsiW
MMHDCENVEMRESLPELAHGALPVTDAERVRAHLADCADCSAELAIIRAAIASSDAARIARRIDVTQMDVARIAAAIPPYRQQRHSWLSATRLQMPMQIAAAALVAAIGITFAVARHDDAPSSRTMQTPVSMSASAAAPAQGGLALISTADVSDANLAKLIGDLDHLDAAPPAEPEPVVPAALENGGGAI